MIFIYLDLSTESHFFVNIALIIANINPGSSAGIISQTIMYPVDTLRKRMQICGFGSQGRKAQIRVVLKEMLASPKGLSVFS